MTPAELKTTHDALGLSAEFIAARAGVHVNNVWRAESPSRTTDVPASIAETMRDLANDYALAHSRLWEELAHEDELPRYADAEDFWMAVPELRGWPRESQGILLSSVADAMERSGPRPRITYH